MGTDTIHMFIGWRPQVLFALKEAVGLLVAENMLHCRKYVTACEHTWMRFWNMKGEQRQNDCPSSMKNNTYFKKTNEEKLQ